MKLVYRFSNYTSDGYSHPTITLYDASSPRTFPNNSKSLGREVIEFRAQTDRDNQTAYGLSAYFSVEFGMIKEALAVLRKLGKKSPYGYTLKAVVKFLRDNKIERAIRSPELDAWVPSTYRNHKQLWVDATAQGMELKRSQSSI